MSKGPTQMPIIDCGHDTANEHCCDGYCCPDECCCGPENCENAR